jgi:hypothetical protein
MYCIIDLRDYVSSTFFEKYTYGGTFLFEIRSPRSHHGLKKNRNNQQYSWIPY